MTQLLAVLDFTDFAVIAVIVLFVTGGASLIGRQQIDLRRVERKLDALLKHHGIELPSRLSPEVQQLARDPSRKIAAIKLHRQQHPGLGLAEAKNEIEDFASSNS